VKRQGNAFVSSGVIYLEIDPLPSNHKCVTMTCHEIVDLQGIAPRRCGDRTTRPRCMLL